MFFKKMIVLALAAMVVAALVAPTVSANWTHSGVKLQAGENPQVQLTGQFITQSAIVGTFDCQTKWTMQLFGGQTTGQIESFEVDLTQAGSTVTNKCKTSGPLAACAMKSLQATNFPWTVHSDGADKVTFTTGQLHLGFESPEGGACGFASAVTLEPGTITAQLTPGQTSGINEFHLSGSIKTSTGATCMILGKPLMTPSGTYGTA